MRLIRRIKKISAFLCGALVGGAGTPTARASLPAAPDDLSVTATASAVSEYMLRGKRLGGPSFQPSVELHAGGLVLGAWSNFPLAGRVAGQSDPEFDFYGSDAFEFGKDTLSVAPGFTLYTYPKAPTAAGYYRAAFEPSLALNYTLPQAAGLLAGVRLSPICYYDLTRRGPTFEFNAVAALPLVHLGTELDLTGTAGTYRLQATDNPPTPGVPAWGDYWLVGVAAPFQIARDSKITVGFAYTKGTNNDLKQGTAGKSPNAADAGRGVLTVSYAVTF